MMPASAYHVPMNRVFYFEIPADDVDRALGFYSSAFGWESTQFSSETPYYFVKTGSEEPGIDGGIMKKFADGQPVTNIIQVEEIDSAIARIEAAGGLVVVPKFPVPGLGWKAFFKDTEGNIFGVSELNSDVSGN